MENSNTQFDNSLQSNTSAAAQAWKHETKSDWKKLLVGILGCLLTLLLICAGSYALFRYFSGQAKDKVENTLPWVEDTKEDSEKFKRSKTINKTVLVDKIQWEVLEAQSSKQINENSACNASEGNRLVYVKFNIKNLDRTLVTVPKSAVLVFDNDMNSFELSANKTFNCLGDQEYTAKDKYVPQIIQLDQEKTFEFIYEVPNDSKDLKLKAGDLSLLGNKFEYIDLGV